MSNEDMESWIQAIKNAIESALDGSATTKALSIAFLMAWIQDSKNAIESALDGSATTLDLINSKSLAQNIKRHPIGDMFSGKGGNNRRTVSGSQETRELLTGASEKVTSTSSKFVQNTFTTIRNADPSNSSCADCGSTTKTEWCSINLAVVLCIGISYLLAS